MPLQSEKSNKKNLVSKESMQIIAFYMTRKAIENQLVEMEISNYRHLCFFYFFSAHACFRIIMNKQSLRINVCEHIFFPITMTYIKVPMLLFLIQSEIIYKPNSKKV